MVTLGEMSRDRILRHVVEGVECPVPREVAQNDLVRGESREGEPGGEEEGPYHDETGAKPKRSSMQI
jgi:hypothetical protein